MTRITNSDQILRLIRQQLSKPGKTGKASKIGNDKTRVQGMSFVRALAQKSDISEEGLKRAVVEGLLSESFGASVINAPEFQRIVDQVTKLISEDPDTDRLLQDAVQVLQET